MSGYGYNNQGNLPSSTQRSSSSYTPSVTPPPVTPPTPPPVTPPVTPPESASTPPEPPITPFDSTQGIDQPSPPTSRVSSVPPVQETSSSPIRVDGYFPLYLTPNEAVEASPSPKSIRPNETTVGYHIHILKGVTYYMPNGLVMGVTQFHGEVDQPLTDTQSLTSATDSLLEKFSEIVDIIKTLEPETVSTEPIEVEESPSQKFELRDSAGNFRIYSVGEIVTYNDKIYEVVREGFGKLPINVEYFKTISEDETETIIDGGSF